MNKMIPSELIHADENGNAVIGKNLEVKGTTKLNGGLKPIHTYEYQGNSIKIYIEIPYSSTSFSFLGCVNDGYITIGYYELTDGTITNLTYLRIDDQGLYYSDGVTETFFATQQS